MAVRIGGFHRIGFDVSLKKDMVWLAVFTQIKTKNIKCGLFEERAEWTTQIQVDRRAGDTNEHQRASEQTKKGWRRARFGTIGLVWGLETRWVVSETREGVSDKAVSNE